ncbi:MAG TPA: CopG family transcriptional regulator [Candidatus Limnocylindria bacterium]|nr:CopG family transcriptional regulator [Candidatus Limnocylindria bacterium]
MKRLRVLIDEDLAARLQQASARTGRSQADLVRESLWRQLLPPLEEDPIWGLAGAGSFDPVPADEIDDIVYGR